MAVKASGRFVPPSAFMPQAPVRRLPVLMHGTRHARLSGAKDPTRDEMRQVQGVLSTINRLPLLLRSLFTSRYDYIRRNKSPVHGFYFLTSTFQRRLYRALSA